nr:NF045616 family extracytoplasmic (lipo)protein [Acinetobacter piscicola]
MSKKLDVIIKNNNLCFFTNDPNTDYGFKGQLLIYILKFDSTKKLKTDFEQIHRNKSKPIPIKKEECLEVPIDKFEKNVVYEVILDTNKTYDSFICIKDENNQIIIKEVKVGETTCPISE